MWLPFLWVVTTRHPFLFSQPSANRLTNVFMMQIYLFFFRCKASYSVKYLPNNYKTAFHDLKKKKNHMFGCLNVTILIVFRTQVSFSPHSL